MELKLSLYVVIVLRRIVGTYESQIRLTEIYLHFSYFSTK